MPDSIIAEDGHLPDVLHRPTTAPRPPAAEPPVPGTPRTPRETTLSCPSCGSGHVAQMLGDNGGVSYVCTACGHTWS
ncbi:hypothetical protein [Streptomyces sp. NPDC058045]|uniref:hypothetical protein n=1 Tax=Streptomyces sp. NPDC058045 TaxID=3346311 RepID=UPI0036E0D7FE